jgi:uncharacterized protein involved in response to NO
MLHIEATHGAPQDSALWSIGFRPFYLLGAAYAALGVLLWALQFSGLLPFQALRGPTWHGHEMLFGFALAIVSGFLLTAVRNWTGQPTPSGGLLAALAALWIAARVTMYLPFPIAAAAVNAAFPWAIAAAIAVPLLRARNRRNYFFVVLLAGIGCAALAMHLGALDVIAMPPARSLRLALDLLLFIVAVLAGRVVPMFTNNGVPGAGAARHKALELASLALVLALVVADALALPAAIVSGIAGAAALAHAVRLALWHPWKTLRAPLVWVLHAAYAWIPVHLVLRALALQGLVLDSLATHALTIGVIGGMTIGMMTRTARGHTGRVLRAGRMEVASYALVQLAAIVRVAGGFIAFDHYVLTVELAALLWSTAFALYFMAYWPILTRPSQALHK